MDHDILIMAGAWVLGAFINGLTGMGGMLVALPLITMFISATSVIIVSSLAGLLVSLLTLSLYWRHINAKEVLGFWAAALPGIFIGVQTLKVVDVELLQLLLCLLIVIHIVVQLIQDWLGTCMAPRAVMKYICGFITGFFNGALGISGPTMAIYTSLMCMRKDQARGFFTSAVPASIISFALVAANGLVTREVLTSAAWVAPAAVAGFVCAYPLARRIKQETFRIAMLILLALAALSLFLRVCPYLLQLFGCQN